MARAPVAPPPAAPRPAAAPARRLGAMLMALLLLGGLALLAARPGGPGTMRVGGVTLAWWYAGLLAPLGAGVLAALLGGRDATTDMRWALALWLMPALWLAVPALLLDGAGTGLWVGLLAVIAPLLAVTHGRRPPPSAEGGPALVHVGALMMVSALLIAANLSLAGRAAERLGGARWQGVAVGAAGAILPLLWRRAERTGAALLVVALVGLALPVLALARVSGLAPLAAWVTMAERRAFEFSELSRWVSEGRDLKFARGTQPLLFEEEHRIAASSAGTVKVLSQDGLRVAQRPWLLAPGQGLVLRPGDRLEPTAGVMLRFEAGKRVPGAPPSGPAWAATSADWVTLLALGVTVLGGALALLRDGPRAPPQRGARVLLGAALFVALAWAQCWAVYGALTSPDVFLGGVSADRLAELPARALEGRRAADVVQGLAAVGALAAFVASSVALRARVAAVDPSGGGEVGRDPGLWGAIIALAAAASLWPLDSWMLTLWGLGLAASAILPALGSGARPPGAARLASVVGLAVFGALLLLGRMRGEDGGSDSALLVSVFAHPAVAALPAALVVGWLGSRVRGRR